MTFLHPQRQFTTLFACLLVAIVIRPFLLASFGGKVAFTAAMTSVFLLAIISLCAEKRSRSIALALGLICIAFRWTELSSGGPGWGERATTAIEVGGRFSEIAFLGWTVAMIVAAIFRRRTVTLDTILGAFAGYLLIALIWGISFSLAEIARPGSFHVHNSLLNEWRSPEQRDWLLNYFSCCTLTTVGYGDITPVVPVARTLAVLEMMMGQLYLAVLVAVLVGVKVAQVSGQPVRDPDAGEPIAK